MKTNTDPRLIPLARRNPRLIIIILGHLYEADEPFPWDEFVGFLTSDEHPWKTVENTIYDLIAFGAIHKIGSYRAKGKTDTRALKLTPLGRAWSDRERIPYLVEDEAEEDDEDF
jgi:hypothetical protein